MHIAVSLRVCFFSGSAVVLAACGARRPTWPAAGPPPAVVKDLQVPENPYRVIYNPPANLAKPPDTTAHGRKPRS